MFIEFNETSIGGKFPSKYSVDLLPGINISASMLISKLWSNDSLGRADTDCFDPATVEMPLECAVLNVHQYSPSHPCDYKHLTSYGFGNPITYDEALQIIHNELHHTTSKYDRNSDAEIEKIFPSNEDYYLTCTGELFWRFPYISHVFSSGPASERRMIWPKEKIGSPPDLKHC